MKALRLWLAYLLAYLFWPCFWLVFYVVNRLIGNSRLSIGQLSFWGPPEFLHLCKDSAERLRKLDPALYARLTEQQSLCLYSATRLEQAYFPQTFSVPDSFTQWGTDGVIARLVYASYVGSAFGLKVLTVRRRVAAVEVHREIKAHTQRWLEQRGFPRRLVESFGELKK
jgi:hypothetical protein